MVMEKLDKFIDGIEEFKTKINDELGSVKNEIKTIHERIDELELKMQKPNTPAEKPDVELKKAFFQYIRTGKTPEGLKAIVEDDTTASVLVPHDIYQEIITSLPKKAIIRRLVTPVPVKGNAFDVRSLGDVTVAWGKLETGTTITESSPTPEKNVIKVEDLVGLIKLGRDILADTDAALEKVIVNNFSSKIAEAEDAAFLTGDGVDKPLGVLKTDGIKSVNTENEGYIAYNDLINAYYELDEEYRKNAVWIMNKNIEKVIRKLTSPAGDYVLTPDPASPMGRTLFGRPVINSPAMPAFYADNEPVILFGDFRDGFVILDKQNGMSVQRLNELYATSGLVGIMVYYRVGGGVIRPDAFVTINITPSSGS